MRHRPTPTGDRAHEVQREQPLPQRLLGGGVDAEHLHDVDRLRGPGLPPALLEPVDRVAARLAVDLDERAVLDPLAAAHPLGVTDQEVPPLRLDPIERARQARPDTVVDPGEDLGRLVDVDHPDARSRPEVDRVAEHRVRPVDPEGRLGRRLAEAEALVDRRLGGGQDRDRLAALPRVVDQPVHHLAHDPQPAVIGSDADAGDAAGRDLPARNGEPERVRAGRADPLLPVERADEPLEVDERALGLDLFLVRGPAECLAQRLPELVQFVGAWAAKGDVGLASVNRATASWT